jgi:hypothetical protein
MKYIDIAKEMLKDIMGNKELIEKYNLDELQNINLESDNDIIAVLKVICTIKDESASKNEEITTTNKVTRKINGILAID